MQGPQMGEPFTTFMWGYWGWGPHTREFVRGVDKVESARGHAPPIFVDIRYSRSVRATGFRDDAFEKTVGKQRYRWMRSLGNAKIGTGESGIKIVDPASAQSLLELVATVAKENRRARASPRRLRQPPESLP